MEVAAQCAARLPAIYELVFLPGFGEKYDEMEPQIWVEVSKYGYDIARFLKLPVNNA